MKSEHRNIIIFIKKMLLTNRIKGHTLNYNKTYINKLKKKIK